MAKEDILSYLEKEIARKIPEDYEVELEWDKKRNQIYIICRLFVENKEGLKISDVDGNFAEEIITFEDIIVLNGGTYELDNEEYLKVIPFDRKKGISKVNLDNLVNSLLDTLNKGKVELIAFLNNDKEIFELDLNYEMTSDNKEMIKYPKF